MSSLHTLRVSQSSRHRHIGILNAGSRTMKCTLGPTGIVQRKSEGDHATPAGIWPLRCVLYRADRLRRPRTLLPVYPIGCHDGWCDDPSDRFYNRPVTLPYPASTETLRRDDHVYDVLVVLGHNDAPVRPGRGSCIFFHLMNTSMGPTEGCVAITLRDMKALLPVCGPRTSMVISR